MNGRKKIVLGNHDLKMNKHPKWWIECDFEEVYRYPVMFSEYYINVSVEQINYTPILFDTIRERLGGVIILLSFF